MYDILHDILTQITNIAILAFEFIGVTILIISGIKGVFNYVTRNPSTRLALLKGMAMGLEFKLGSEILRTVILREYHEIIIVAAIIVLRAVLTFVIHWEIRVEQESVDE